MNEYYKHVKDQAHLVEKWAPLLDVDNSGTGGAILDESTRLATAVVLENAERENMLTESFTGAISSAGQMGTGTGTFGTTTDYGPNDSRIPSILVPTIRRFFPQLIAHDLCGVQPLGAPLGFAFALRRKYGINGLGKASGTDSQGTEMGYLTTDARFTGTSGLTTEQLSANFGSTTTGINGQLVPGVGTTTEANEFWQAFAGTNSYFDGRAAATSDAEWQKIGEDMPMTTLNLEKGVVVARTRKLGAGWSLENAEDSQAMHNLNLDTEMGKQLSYEIKAEIDRHILSHMVKTAIVGGSRYTSTWSPVSADGRNQFERIGALYTHILDKSQDIAIYSQRGAANRAVVSPRVAALLQRLYDSTGYVAANKDGGSNVQATTQEGTIAKVGYMNQSGITVYRDIFSRDGNYILLAYKGNTAIDAGVIYCPYVPFQLMRAMSPQDFSPRMAMRTRYGVLDNLMGSANYYQLIKVDDLTGTTLNSDGSRVFLY